MHSVGFSRRGRFLPASALGLLVAALGFGCEAGGGEKGPVPATAVTATRATAAQPAPSLKLGAPITETRTVPLDAIARSTGQYANAVVRTEGKVTAVCQARGCWMEIVDDKSSAHIRMTGHSFFVPRTAAGRHAVVMGKVLPAPDDGECEEEAKEATGKPVKVELDATGVELL